ncbi:MAG TPA: tryptophan 2,3-dioxygenase family protein [Sphingobacteriaceae bacterium]
MEITPEILERLEKLQQKFDTMGQDMVSYLDGLLYADYLTYWDYIHLDTLLSLQTPKTSFPDEKIFILYHQVTELYFKLALHECEQISFNQDLTAAGFTSRLKRINSYFHALTNSFEIMVEGMDKEQFLKFRMALLPASGFQSAQYRMIEIYATDFERLIAAEKRADLRDAALAEQFEYIYWKFGATELATGKKTLTLRQFEEKYSAGLLDLASKVRTTNFRSLYNKLRDTGTGSMELEEELRRLDVFVNVTWPLSHFKSAVKYLHREPEEIRATGGTNWQKYLPPRFQKRIFFPELWTPEQLENWGKNWVLSVLETP